MNNYDKCQNYLAGRNRMEDLFSVCGKIRLRKGEGRTLKAGGAWVYDNEIEWMSDGIIDGHLVEVLDLMIISWESDLLTENPRLQ